MRTKSTLCLFNFSTCSFLFFYFFLNHFTFTSVDGGQRERRQSLALDLPLLLQAPLGLQDWVLKLSPSIDVARKCKDIIKNKGKQVIQLHKCEKVVVVLTSHHQVFNRSANRVTSVNMTNVSATFQLLNLTYNV